MSFLLRYIPLGMGPHTGLLEAKLCQIKERNFVAVCPSGLLRRAIFFEVDVITFPGPEDNVCSSGVLQVKGSIHDTGSSPLGSGIISSRHT